MLEQYRKANDRIHVPEELMRRTKEAVRQEEKKTEGSDDTEIHRSGSVFLSGLSRSVEIYGTGPDHCTGSGDCQDRNVDRNEPWIT